MASSSSSFLPLLLSASFPASLHDHVLVVFLSHLLLTLLLRMSPVLIDAILSSSTTPRKEESPIKHTDESLQRMPIRFKKRPSKLDLSRPSGPPAQASRAEAIRLNEDILRITQRKMDQMRHIPYLQTEFRYAVIKNCFLRGLKRRLELDLLPDEVAFAASPIYDSFVCSTDATHVTATTAEDLHSPMPMKRSVPVPIPGATGQVKEKRSPSPTNQAAILADFVALEQQDVSLDQGLDIRTNMTSTLQADTLESLCIQDDYLRADVQPDQGDAAWSHSKQTKLGPSKDKTSKGFFSIKRWPFSSLSFRKRYSPPRIPVE